LLLDTSTVLWWFAGNPRVSAATRHTITYDASAVFVSVVSLWEIAIKNRLGRLDARAAEVATGIRRTGWRILAIEPAHLAALETLPTHHRDPFDHLLIAQAIAEGLTIVTDDRHTPLYPVRHAACA
jgi:PIN domain nuclease of toxin-antitoxin system